MRERLLIFDASSRLLIVVVVRLNPFAFIVPRKTKSPRFSSIETRGQWNWS